MPGSTRFHVASMTPKQFSERHKDTQFLVAHQIVTIRVHVIMYRMRPLFEKTERATSVLISAVVAGTLSASHDGWKLPPLQ